MTERRLPSHITEDDVRLISQLCAPVFMAQALRAAADGISPTSRLASSGAVEYLTDLADRCEAEISPWLEIKIKPDDV